MLQVEDEYFEKHGCHSPGYNHSTISMEFDMIVHNRVCHLVDLGIYEETTKSRFPNVRALEWNIMQACEANNEMRMANPFDDDDEKLARKLGVLQQYKSAKAASG